MVKPLLVLPVVEPFVLGFYFPVRLASFFYYFIGFDAVFALGFLFNFFAHLVWVDLLVGLMVSGRKYSSSRFWTLAVPSIGIWGSVIWMLYFY